MTGGARPPSSTSSTTGTTREAFALAGVAGFVDGVGVAYVSGVFVSFMSGNTTSTGGRAGHRGLGLARACRVVVLVAVAIRVGRTSQYGPQPARPR